MADVFDGRNALIFGGAQGIGRAMSMEFARRGAHVAIADIDPAGAEEAARAVTDLGRKAHAVVADVGSETSVEAAIVSARDALGSIDIVVNNVGAIVTGRPEDIPIAEWQRLIDLNLMGAIRGFLPLLPEMLERGSGHIVNTASFAGLYPYATVRLPYVAAKAGLIALTESLAIHCEPKGVRVSAFCPGPVATGIADKMRSFGEDVEFRGPGSEYDLLTAAEAATVLANAMEAGRIVIPSDEKAWVPVAEHGADPDAFIRAKIDQFAAGDLGSPQIGPDLKERMQAMPKP